MITIATLLWDANDKSFDFSKSYDESWVDKLYRGFARNLSKPFRFVCFTDRFRVFREQVIQYKIEAERPDYSTCIQPYSLNEPMILVGLDTVVVGNCDALADYCMRADVLAVPRDPYAPRSAPDTVCNGVALVPGGMRATMWDRFDGRNDMEWIRANPHAILDDIFPGAVVSYKGHAKGKGIDGVSIVYFHGREKPGEIGKPWLRDHWL